MLTEPAPEVHRLAHVACLARAVAAAGNQRVYPAPANADLARRRAVLRRNCQGWRYIGRKTEMNPEPLPVSSELPKVVTPISRVYQPKATARSSSACLVVICPRRISDWSAVFKVIARLSSTPS